jgi:hypothetical protein
VDLSHVSSLALAGLIKIVGESQKIIFLLLLKADVKQTKVNDPIIVKGDIKHT